MSCDPDRSVEDEDVFPEIHVAVGSDKEKEILNLLWVLSNFRRCKVNILHVHLPSRRVRVLGGDFHESLISEKVLRKQRFEERNKMIWLLQQYMEICVKKKVQVRTLVTIKDDVLEGIEHLTVKHGIKRLVMASRSMSKQANLCSYCQIILVRNGEHIFTSNIPLITEGLTSRDETEEASGLDSDNSTQNTTSSNELVQFLHETFQVRVLKIARHPHIINLMGVCPESSALVYEYMAHGNLEDRLSGRTSNIPKLNWQDRIRILAEQRSALIFLHTNTPFQIVHGDLKLSNVLLDKNNTSKLADFGTASLLTEDASKEKTENPATPIGTLGYMDPTALTTGELTPASDVYAFGIIILCLLTKFPALNISEKVEENLRMGSLGKMLDSSAGEWPLLQIEQLLRLGLRCCSTKREERPSIVSKDWRVLEMLRAMAEASRGKISLSNGIRIKKYRVARNVELPPPRRIKIQQIRHR